MTDWTEQVARFFCATEQIVVMVFVFSVFYSVYTGVVITLHALVDRSFLCLYL